jgi:prepilin-type N-terminal cleavage/methylation domain-containing protein
MKKHTSHLKNGFTLVELLVSLAIFSIVVVASLGAMLSIADANRRVQKTRAVLDNLSLSMESISRNLRLGSTYHCEKISSNVIPNSNLGVTQNCRDSTNNPILYGDFIAFEDQFGNQIDNSDQAYYYLDEVSGRIMYKKFNAATTTALTSDDLTIKSLRFYVTGVGTSTPPNASQPKIIIVVSGSTEIGKAQEPVEINLQTTVSQRPLNI